MSAETVLGRGWSTWRDDRLGQPRQLALPWRLRCALVGAAWLLAVLPAVSLAQGGCGFLDPKLTFPDGGKACLAEFPLLTRPGVIASKDYADLVAVARRNPGSYAMAATQDPQRCPFVQFTAWNWKGLDGKEALSQCEQRMRDATRGDASLRNCGCEVVVETGRTKLPRSELSQRLAAFENFLRTGVTPEQARLAQARESSDAQRQTEERERAEVAKREEQARLAEAQRREAQRMAEERRQAEEREKAEAARREEAARLAEARRQAEERERAEAARREEEARLAEARRREAERVAAAQQSASVALTLPVPTLPVPTLPVAPLAAAAVSSVLSSPAPALPPAVPTGLELAGPGSFSSRVALVIGNAAYSGRWALKNPGNDAVAIAERLKALGFEVMLHLDVRVSQIGDILAAASRRMRPGGAFVFYYAGHGLQLRSENYLPAVDANIRTQFDVPTQSLSLQNILNLADDAKSELRLIFLDACRDNPWQVASRSLAGGLAKIEPPKGTLISYATRPGSTAEDGEGSNGIYTSQLLRHIATPNLPVESVFKRVAGDVYRATNGRQEPWYEGNLRGEFAFLVTR